MVTLPGLETYQKVEIQEFAQTFPVCAHYLRLIEREPKQPADHLRYLKHKEWLKSALASFFRREHPETVCRYWSEQTDILLTKAWQLSGLEEQDMGLIALGKLGSQELNLSSDVDLLLFTSQEQPTEVHLNGTRRFMKMLTESTAYGFAYRVDLGLRPGGESSSIITPLQQLYNFYDSQLEPWHRISFVRWRSLLGDSVQLSELDRYIQRLAYPRRLDFSIIQGVKSVRNRLNLQWRKANEPLDIKFHPGGIRDIELYIQALQVIYGGKRPEAQQRGFSKALESLKTLGVLSDPDHQTFHKFYWQLRELENLIHLSEDKQSYLAKESILRLPQSPLNEVQLTQGLSLMAQVVSEFFNETIEDPQTDLASIAGKFSTRSQRAIEGTLNLQSQSLRKEGNDLMKRKVLAQYLAYVEAIAIDQDLAIETFRDFTQSIRAKSSIFHLLSRSPELVENLAWLFSVSPFMGQVICRRPELLDSFSLGAVNLHDFEDLEDLIENLHDYKLLGNLVSVIYLLRNRDIQAYGQSLSDRADQVAQTLLDYLKTEAQVSSLGLLCLGKWGGRELGILSDLDLIFLSEQTPEISQVQVARKFINILTTRHRVGALYSVDLRLKPEETSAPLMIPSQQLIEFLDRDADPWQKQAYLRARELGAERIFLADHLTHLHLSQTEAVELQKIHQRLLTPLLPDSFDVKTVSGGLLHTEFTVQKCFLQKGLKTTTSKTHHLIDHLQLSYGDQIKRNYDELRLLEQISQICHDSPRTKVLREASGLERISRILRIDSVFEHFQGILKQQQELLKELDLSC